MWRPERAWIYSRVKKSPEWRIDLGGKLWVAEIYRKTKRPLEVQYPIQLVLVGQISNSFFLTSTKYWVGMIKIRYVTWPRERNREKRRWFIAFPGRQRIQGDLTMLRLSTMWVWGSAWRPFGPPELSYKPHWKGQTDKQNQRKEKKRERYEWSHP